MAAGLADHASGCRAGPACAARPPFSLGSRCALRAATRCYARSLKATPGPRQCIVAACGPAVWSPPHRQAPPGTAWDRQGLRLCNLGSLLLGAARAHTAQEAHLNERGGREPYPSSAACLGAIASLSLQRRGARTTARTSGRGGVGRGRAGRGWLEGRYRLQGVYGWTWLQLFAVGQHLTWLPGVALARPQGQGLKGESETPHRRALLGPYPSEQGLTPSAPSTPSHHNPRWGLALLLDPRPSR